MSRKEKILKRLNAIPSPVDFTYNELEKLLGMYGYSVTEGSGYRISFGPNKKGNILDLHKPHGKGENALKRYQIEKIKAFIDEEE